MFRMKIIGGVLAAFSSWRFVSADMGGIDSFLKEVAAVTPGMDGYDELKKIWITSNESNVAAFLQPTTIGKFLYILYYE